MKTKPALFLSVFWLSVRVQTQTLNISACVGPLTAAPNCNFYASKLEACNSLVGSAAGQCYCPQTVLNAIAGCESEFRLCIGGYEFDSEFQGPDGYFGLWHSACDGFITYTPTTPAITTLSITFNPANCLTAESYCGAFGSSTDSCASAYTILEKLKSCRCQATILDLASRCEVDGSVSCLLETPKTTNLWSYKNCRGSTMDVPNSSGTSSRVILTSQAAVISTVSPSLTASAVMPTSTSTSTSSASHLLQINCLLLANSVLAIVMQLV